MEQLMLTKTFKDHDIEMLVQFDLDKTVGVAQCIQCDKHIHFENMDFTDADSMMLIEGEFQLHSSGVEDGWQPGLAITDFEEE